MTKRLELIAEDISEYIAFHQSKTSFYEIILNMNQTFKRLAQKTECLVFVDVFPSLVSVSVTNKLDGNETVAKVALKIGSRLLMAKERLFEQN